MRGPGSAESHCCEFTWVHTAPHSDNANRRPHFGIDQIVYTLCSLHYGEFQRFSHFTRNCFVALLRKNLHLAAKEVFRIEVSQHHVRVGDGGPFATKAIAGGSRIGSRAFGPDMEKSSAVDPCYATAARSNFRQIDHGHLHRLAAFSRTAAHSGPNTKVVSDGWLAIRYQGQFCGGATHIERNDVFLLAKPAQIRGGDNSRGRTGLDAVHSLSRRGRG